MSRTDILKAHYLELIKRIVVWIGFGSLMAMAMLPMTASAVGELEPRSTAIGTSAAAGVTSYTFSFRPSATATIDAITFQICDSPVQAVGCANSAGSSGASFTTDTAAFTTAGQSAPFNATWATGTGGTCGAPTTNTFCISNGTGSSLNNATTYSVTVTNVLNPSAANTEFYTRITTWTNAAGTLPAGGQDFGGEAVSTGTQFAVSGLVQESLVFGVGTTGTCPSPSGTTTYEGGSASSVISQTAASAATAVACVSTNAASGYTLSMLTSTGVGTSGSFANQTGTSHSFNDCTGALACTATGDNFTTGTASNTQDFFGMSLIQATGANGDVLAGQSPTGGTAITSYGTGYGTADKFDWARNANGVTLLATESTGPSATETFTPVFEAQAAPNTNFGQYQVNVNMIATSTF